MSAVDLTEPVNAAAKYLFGIDAERLGIDRARLGQAWDDAKPAVKHAYRESVLGAVVGAAPVIEAQIRAQVRAQIAAEILASRLRRLDGLPSGEIKDLYERGVLFGQSVDVRIARGDS